MSLSYSQLGLPPSSFFFLLSPSCLTLHTCSGIRGLDRDVNDINGYNGYIRRNWPKGPFLLLTT
ncbi:hypothetical protein M378DRAFT_170062 [Amanita muscaria Koide BX008]|uniref:Uncharacterized protein n=1 Tax=Amanita muscaria (strain Koide BX008) TaxID=946122 RepID=A0A0C2S7X5_AMAMK|nr:hypothetical protein M378DRAFT_170062 [Amanita muscaria Koide BX008]